MGRTVVALRPILNVEAWNFDVCVPSLHLTPHNELCERANAPPRDAIYKNSEERVPARGHVHITRGSRSTPSDYDGWWFHDANAQFRARSPVA